MVSFQALGRLRPQISSRERPARLWLVASVLVAAAGFFIGGTDVVEAARTWHVATTGTDAADGTSGQPLRTIGAAVDRAASGDAIEISGGIYRESVQVYRKALQLRSRPGERAVLDGSQRVDGWRSSGGAFVVDGWTTQFESSFDPPVLSTNQTAGLPDQVFLDGQPLIQVTSRAAVVSGRFFHDIGQDQLWIADNPAGRVVDVSNRSWGLYLNEANGTSVTDLTVRRFATERRHVAAIRAYGDGLVLDGVVAEQNAAIGISVIGQDVTVRNGRSSDNGYMGIHADRATRLTIDSMSVIANNRAGFDPFHSAAGIKVTTVTDVVIRDSHVAYNDGPGIWTDINSQSATIIGNLVENNRRSGIEIELTAGAVIASNTAVANLESGIWVLESTDVQVWNNAALDNRWQIRVEEGPRRDVRNVTLRNNVVGAAGGGEELLHVNDWTERRSYQEMGVTFDHTLFWRSGGRALSRVGHWPTSVSTNSSIGEHRALPDGATNSVLVDGALPAIGATCGDYRVPDGIMSAAPLPAAIATLLGVSASPRPVGPVSAAPRFMYAWPTNAASQSTPIGGGVDSSGTRQAVRVGSTSVGPSC